MPSLLPALVKHSLGNATALTRHSSQHLRNGRCEAPTYLAETCPEHCREQYFWSDLDGRFTAKDFPQC